VFYIKSLLAKEQKIYKSIKEMGHKKQELD